MSTPPGIDYAALIQDALRGVVRDLLARVADEGLPGEHFFYLTFRTDGEGVEMPAALRAAYPEEMTVVLQHRYRELVVDDAAFAVTLFFDGQPQRLCVPWSALSAFVDPSAELGLRFDPEPDEAPARSADEGPSNVVSFDRFRGGGPGEPES